MGVFELIGAALERVGEALERLGAALCCTRGEDDWRAVRPCARRQQSWAQRAAAVRRKYAVKLRGRDDG